MGTGERRKLIHYRSAGSGHPLVMLHASPMSSAALLPLIEIAKEYASVIAPDTPGYGWSDPLLTASGDLRGYVAALNGFTERLGLEKFGLYGSATGAQIAIEYGKAYPEQISYVILDNAAHFTDAERDAIAAGYFPDLTPDATGSHLTRTWSMARDQGVFFPWHQRTAAARLPASAINVEFVQMIALDYLQAGRDYDRAYRAAFANEKIERLQALTVPTFILRWQGSILRPYTDHFDAVEWPDNFTMVHCGPGREERLAGFKKILMQQQSLPERTMRPVATSQSVRPGKGFMDLGCGQVHYLAAGEPHLPPMLLLHDPGSSHRSLADFIDTLTKEHFIVAPDLPGHGLSARPQGAGLAAMVAVLRELVISLGWDEFQIRCVKGSAALGVELAKVTKQFVQTLTLTNPLDYSIVKDEWVMEKEQSRFPVNAAGTHFLQSWYMLRDRQLFWPWYRPEPGHALAGQPNLGADYLTERFKEYWIAQTALHDLWPEILTYPLSARIDQLDCPVKVKMIADDPLTPVALRSLGAERCEMIY